MKTILLTVCLCFFSLGSAAGDASTYSRAARTYLEEVDTALKEFQNTKNPTILANASESNNKAYEAAETSYELSKIEFEMIYIKAGVIPSSRQTSDHFEKLNELRDILFSRTCNYDNTIAQAFRKDLNQPDVAKERYRTVLKRYKIDTKYEKLKVCVKDAEFALEDIAADMQKPQQQATTEMDNLKKENELLKKEIELLKSENADLKSKLKKKKY
jgi:hypothetical protein